MSKYTVICFEDEAFQPMAVAVQQNQDVQPLLDFIKKTKNDVSIEITEDVDFEKLLAYNDICKKIFGDYEENLIAVSDIHLKQTDQTWKQFLAQWKKNKYNHWKREHGLHNYIMNNEPEF